jgi:hypothetical protein
MPYYRQAMVALALLPALFAGCKSADKPAQSSSRATRLFAVTVDSAAFFRRGPRQGLDPDLRLPRDTVVKLIRPSFGYSKIQVVSSGVQGYIASEEIRPASSTLLAAATTPPSDPMAPHTSDPAIEQFNLNSNDSRLVPPPEQLPGVDLPAPAPGPEP